MRWRWLPALLLLLAALPAAAQTADPALKTAADGLVAILDGRGAATTYFAPSFRAAVPDAQFAQVTAQLKAALGTPRQIAAFRPTAPYAAALTIAYERGTAAVTLAIDPAPPHQVVGLLVTGTSRADDTPEKLIADFKALPGAAGLGIYTLGDGAPRPALEWRGDMPAPLGSAFKLWVLAEAARRVRAGERRWADVIPLGPPSLPSGITQSWPTGTPMTLQALATLMISISDNSATDTLLHALGRDKVSALAATLGATPASLPILSTRELFYLKAHPDLAAAWAKGGPADRAALLARTAPRIAAATLDPAMFAKPLLTDTVEWFATPRGMATLLDRLRTADTQTHAILAVNAGTDPATAARFAYIGYKGGSEPGVLTLNYLVHTQDGRWLAVVGNWHREDGETPTLPFATLMNRALALIADQAVSASTSARTLACRHCGSGATSQ